MFLLDVDTQTFYQIQKITIDYWEWIVVFIMFMAFTFLAHRKKIIYINKQPEFRYYVWGFYAKFISSVFFVIVFYYIYQGGDTYGYFASAMSMANLFYKNPEGYFYVMTHGYSPETKSYFDFFTGYPWDYLCVEAPTYLVVKLSSPFAIITKNSFLISNVLIGILTYRGNWKLFQLFYRYYPKISFQLAISLLFIPSALFYGSGILKDSFTYMAACLFTVYFHDYFILKIKSMKAVFFLILYAILMLGIKPYIFMILLPGLFFWAVFKKYDNIKNNAIRLIILPIMILIVMGGSLLFFVSLDGVMNKFSINNAMQTASTAQNDLKKDYYEGESFDIGNFDGTIPSALRLFPSAVFAGMFRPMIIEARSPLVLLSALENLFLLYLFVRIFFRASIVKIYTTISKDPILIFCLFFSLFFAFMLGLTTSNYGALTRFKIPMLPFFTGGLFIINYKLKELRRISLGR